MCRVTCPEWSANRSLLSGGFQLAVTLGIEQAFGDEANSRLPANSLFAIYFAGKFGDEIQQRAPAQLAGHGAAAFGEGASGAGLPGGR
jgi:hypothetical protein